LTTRYQQCLSYANYIFKKVHQAINTHHLLLMD